MAAPNLPEGVITSNTHGVSRDLRNIDVLTDEEVTQLWTTYHSKQALLANDVGRRLAYFFWRLWSSEKLRKTLAGSQVATIFEEISEGAIIRTTPKSSPRHSRIMPPPQDLPTPTLEADGEIRRLSVSSAEDSESSDAKAAPLNARARSVSRTEDETTPDGGPRRFSRDQPQPTPILKKPGSESYGGSGKTARIQPPAFKTRESDPDHDEPMSPEEARELSRQISSESALSIDHQISGPVDLSPAVPYAIGSSLGNSSSLSAVAAAAAAPTRMSRSASGQDRPSRRKPKTGFVVGRKRPLAPRRLSSQANSASKTSPGLRPSRTFDSIAGLSGAKATDGQQSPARSDTTHGMYRLTSSRSASPISQSTFRRVPKDHQKYDGAGLTTAAVHNRALSAAALENEFVPLRDPSLSAVNMHRSLSSQPLSGGTVTPKSLAASSSSSNIQAAGRMSIDQPSPGIASAPRAAALSLLNRAGSFFSGRGGGRGLFDIGPPDYEGTDASRRSSIENIPTELSPKSSSFSVIASSSSAATPSRSQSQLSGLLEQEKRKDAEQKRRRDHELQEGRR